MYVCGRYRGMFSHDGSFESMREAKRLADEADAKFIAETEVYIKRKLTDKEKLRGEVERPDDRDRHQLVQDLAWKPKVKTDPNATRFDSLVDSLSSQRDEYLDAAASWPPGPRRTELI